MSKYQVNNHSVLKVSNDEAKNGASWHDIARGRAFKQHGDIHDTNDLPAGDIHAIHRHHDDYLPKTNPEEMNRELSALEDQIKQLQATENEKAQARQMAKQQQEQHHGQQKESYEDDPYEDWLKE